MTLGAKLDIIKWVPMVFSTNVGPIKVSYFMLALRILTSLCFSTVLGNIMMFGPIRSFLTFPIIKILSSIKRMVAFFRTEYAKAFKLIAIFGTIKLFVTHLTNKILSFGFRLSITNVRTKQSSRPLSPPRRCEELFKTSWADKWFKSRTDYLITFVTPFHKLLTVMITLVV